MKLQINEYKFEKLMLDKDYFPKVTRLAWGEWCSWLKTILPHTLNLFSPRLASWIGCAFLFTVSRNQTFRTVARHALCHVGRHKKDNSKGEPGSVLRRNYPLFTNVRPHCGRMVSRILWQMMQPLKLAVDRRSFSSHTLTVVHPNGPS